ncbi:unnamed protein product, partial [Pylaiella littoralis]
MFDVTNLLSHHLSANMWSKRLRTHGFDQSRDASTTRTEQLRPYTGRPVSTTRLVSDCRTQPTQKQHPATIKLPVLELFPTRDNLQHSPRIFRYPALNCPRDLGENESTSCTHVPESNGVTSPGEPRLRSPPSPASAKALAASPRKPRPTIPGVGPTVRWSPHLVVSRASHQGRRS